MQWKFTRCWSILPKLVGTTGVGDTCRFRLTTAGVKEGGRRFADEFADVTKPGHFECADPHCECKLTGNPADCAYQR